MNGAAFQANKTLDRDMQSAMIRTDRRYNRFGDPRALAGMSVKAIAQMVAAA